jgi:mannose-6-phosphate isomerase-like protein (cupin superfamily)
VNVEKIVAKLKKDYPEKNIVLNPPENPTEIVCETNPEKGLAVIVIDSSIPHHHLHTTEIYRVTKGNLTLYIDGNEKELSEGDEFTIYPNEVHFAIGSETWIDEQSTPPWTAEDHIIEETIE